MCCILLIHVISLLMIMTFVCFVATTCGWNRLHTYQCNDEILQFRIGVYFYGGVGSFTLAH